MYRSYYMNGKLQGEGQFISIDPFDDNKSVFDGEFKTYFENGLIETHGYFKEGVREGIMSEFSNDGMICSQLEFSKGKALTDYYTVTNENGYISKIRLSDNSPIWESPTIDEKKNRFVEGKAWPYYIKNGMLISMNLSIVKDYGRYYRIDLILSNNTMGPVDFEPNDIKAILTDNKGQRWYLGVFPAENYMRKVTRSQNFAMAMNGLVQGLAAASAGYSTATTTSNTSYSGNAYASAYGSAYGSGGYVNAYAHGSGYYSGNSRTTTTTTAYNGAAAYQASMIASQNIAAFDDSMLAEREAKDKGYLKLTTIEPGESISGYILVEKKGGTHLCIIVDIYGAEYQFPWTLK